MRLLSLSLALTLGLAACSGEGPSRFAVPVTPVEGRVGIAYSTVEVLDVTLPVYAQAEEISVERLSGGITREAGMLWADLPARGVTLDLTRALGLITGAQVASSPWPFDRRPQVRVEVRIEEMVASEQGVFRLSGQYFVGAFDGSERGRARAFALSVPLDLTGGAPAIAAARGQVTVLLAQTIAQDGLR